MESKPLGESKAKAGQLLSLYVEDDVLPVSVTLYVLKDFDLSNEMAEYHELHRRVGGDKSETVIGTFSAWLAEKGLVENPSRSDIVVLGRFGRPPARMISEWKYRKNPEAFIMDRIRRTLHVASLYMFTHDGQYLILLDHGQSQDEVILEISHKGEAIGMVHLDLFTDSKRRVKINDDDLQKIKALIETIFNERLHEEELSVTRVFTNIPCLSERFELIPAQPA